LDGRGNRRAGGRTSESLICIAGKPIQRVPRLHQKAEQVVSIVFIRRRGKAGAGGRNCQHAKQIGIADPRASVDDHPNARGQITMKPAVPNDPVSNLTEGFRSSHGATRLGQKIAQLHDLLPMAERYIGKL
jgi:hypothetical protein